MADTFTEQERHAIDDIYKREFQNMTADEVALYGRWIAEQTRLETEHSAQIALWREESAARQALRHEQAATAKANLNELRDAALARLAAIDGA